MTGRSHKAPLRFGLKTLLIMVALSSMLAASYVSESRANAEVDGSIERFQSRWSDGPFAITSSDVSAIFGKPHREDVGPDGQRVEEFRYAAWWRVHFVRVTYHDTGYVKSLGTQLRPHVGLTSGLTIMAACLLFRGLRPPANSSRETLADVR